MRSAIVLELYHNAMSVCAQKVRVALAEKGIAYTGYDLNIRAGECRTPAYLALNPNGVVPTLVVDGKLSFAVAFRLQDSSKQMANRKPSEAINDLMDVMKHGLDSPEIALRIGVVQKVLGDMATRLGDHDWLVGDAFSLADIAMLPYVCRLRDLHQSWLWAEGSPYASVSAWLERCYAKRGYAGISDFFDAKYLAVMESAGREAEPKIRELMAA
jgi:glutathione S-transferase